MRRKRIYSFKELEQYREYLETKHLRRKNFIVSGVFLVLFLLTIVYMVLYKYSMSSIIPVGIGYLLLLSMNLVLTAYGEEDSSYLKINKYVSTLGMFTLSMALLILFQSPSFIPLLFVAYCVCAIYQDVKVLIISDIYFLVSIILTVLSYPQLLSPSLSSSTNFSIIFFSILFLLMLSVSTYIIMKEKAFFYNQISNSKENEYRNIDLLIKLRYKTNKQDKNIIDCYDKTNDFLQAFCNKIEVPNIFEEKINILKNLENNVAEKDIINKNPEYNMEDLKRLKKILIGNHDSLNRIVVKVSKTRESKIKKREIFSSTHFKSFNKPSDTIETKIIAFVVFYVALKKGLLGMNRLSNEDIFNTLNKTDYYYYIDSRIMKIYEENSDVFDVIISDAFGKGGN